MFIVHTSRSVLERQEQVRAEMELEGTRIEGGELGILLLRDNISSYKDVSMVSRYVGGSEGVSTFEVYTLEIQLQNRIRVFTNKDAIALTNCGLR